ncbi:MAG: tRNA pseudouridine(38-40) synthase TruA [Alphaproteobacteria bacterium]|nr:tRNA pseudouridine(38-40) synthase TruA [Alphaproteobacteria bacterium]
MTRYKLTLEYNGTTLIGWQENIQGPSVQSLVRDAVFKFCQQDVEVIAAGRTDAGVHALGMVCHFDIVGDSDAETVMRALNFYLIDSPVAVLDCEIVSDDFHARFSCTCRNYRYIILNRRAPVIMDKNMVWWIPRPLNVEKMQAAAAKLVGNHDWTSFRASECQAKSPIKTLDKADIEICDMAYGEKGEMQGQYIIMNFSARSFLHHQVRNMVGTLVEIGLGKPFDIDEVFAAKNRSAAGPTAPSSGLYFVSAEYANND